MKEEKELKHYGEGWRGFSLEELRYQRAVAMARMEIQKEKMSLQITDLKQHVPGSGTGLVGKMMSGLSYLDYILLAFKITRSLSRFVGRKRK